MLEAFGKELWTLGAHSIIGVPRTFVLELWVPGNGTPGTFGMEYWVLVANFGNYFSCRNRCDKVRSKKTELYEHTTGIIQIKQTFKVGNENVV